MRKFRRVFSTKGRVMADITLTEGLLWAIEAVKAVAGVVENGRDIKRIEFRDYVKGDREFNGTYDVVNLSSPDGLSTAWFRVFLDLEEVRMENGEGDFMLTRHESGMLIARPKVPA